MIGGCRLAIDESPIADWRSTDCRLAIGRGNPINPPISDPSIGKRAIGDSSIANLQSPVGN